MPVTSCGLLMYRRTQHLEYFLVHPGGPFYAGKDAGVWTIPKGLPYEGEELLAAAIREFTEETGIVPQPPFIPLGTARMKSGKTIHAWAFEGDWEESTGITSTTITIEWTPRSKKQLNIPEVDRAKWYRTAEAVIYAHESQRVFIERCAAAITNSAH